MWQAEGQVRKTEGQVWQTKRFLSAKCTLCKFG